MKDKTVSFDIEELRARLRAMPNRQLDEFRKTAEYKCSTRLKSRQALNVTFIIELEEANAECARRYVDKRADQ